jgi:hypothetical protein
MSTSIYENPADLLAPSWETDADLNWVETDTYQPTKRKVEGIGTISDFIASMPREAELEGILTAATLDPVTLQPQRLVDLKNKIQALAAKKQVVLVINPDYEGYLAITKVQPKKSAEDGHSLKVSISFQEIERTITATAQVPASKLKPKVKRRAASGAKGGAAKGRAPTPRERTKTATVVDAVKGMFR